MDHIVTRSIRLGDKVVQDQGTVRLGDMAPIFAPRRIRAGDKVEQDQGKVRLGDMAPIFAR
jgi:hypothetical protein